METYVCWTHVEKSTLPRCDILSLLYDARVGIDTGGLEVEEGNGGKAK